MKALVLKYQIQKTEKLKEGGGGSGEDIIILENQMAIMQALVDLIEDMEKSNSKK